MKILHVSTSDTRGGAARAAHRLHGALLAQEVESCMLVQDKGSGEYTVLGAPSGFQRILSQLRPLIDSLPVRLYKKRARMLFSPAWWGTGGIAKRINALQPDIVHLHWVQHGMIRIEEIAKIEAPIVWSLHDNWVFSGGCHIMWECERYKMRCGACPRLGSNRENDLSRYVFNRKHDAFSKKEMTIVGVSRWLSQCAKESTLLRDKNHINLPNPIDTNVYKPFDKEASRALWNLPQERLLILFGALSAVTDINKGYRELIEALHNLTDKTIELVIFGSSAPEVSPDFGFKTHYLGHLNDDVSLVTLYSAVDLLVVPSRQEAFGQTASESMACGTPVVAFNHTGLVDVVEHQENGYLAMPFDADDFKNGIEWVLGHPRYDELCKNARKKVVETFDSTIVAKQYLRLYETALGGSHV